MAHDFLKRIVESDNRDRVALYTFLSLSGVFFFANAYILRYFQADSQLSSLTMLLAALLLGAPLVINAINDLFVKRLEMNELAALSYGAALSTAQYDVAAIIAFFMFISQLIEYRSETATRKNIQNLMKLSPKRVTVKTDKGFEERDAESLRVDDIVLVRPGDTIPCDGVVAEGASWVDESTITGESVPVHKKAGASVYCGTSNQSGSMNVRMTAPARDSTLEVIKRLISQAELKRPPVVRLINRYASWYTATVLFISAAAFFISRDVNRAIAILVVACPCILLLSGPTAIVAALSAAARLGVIIKDVSKLEVVKSVTSVFFDKTGTLSTGDLRICAIEMTDSLDTHEMATCAWSLEQHSTHPIAKALSHYAEQQSITPRAVEAFSEKPGFGVTGTINGSVVAVGRKEWIESFDSSVSIRTDTADAKTSLYVMRDGCLMGAIGLSDSLRPEARKTIDDLKKLKLRHIRILTGDNRIAAERIAQQVGCEVSAELLPHQKLAEVEKSRAAGETVAIVGDGINDAPALAAADVSIAMGVRGSDIAIDTATVVLMNDTLNRIPFLFELSTKLVSIIHQNILFSISFIVAMIVLSALGFVSPIAAVILHTASTGFIVLNSARLLKAGEHIA